MNVRNTQQGHGKDKSGREKLKRKDQQQSDIKQKSAPGRKAGSGDAASPKHRKPEKSSAGCVCLYAGQCGGCQLIDMPYEQQLQKKQEMMEKLLGKFGRVQPIIGMKDPLHYRHKVTSTFGQLKNGQLISGIYQEGTHRIIPIDSCPLQQKKADEIIQTIRKLAVSFKIRPYHEDRGTGFLRHVMVRAGWKSGEIMVILVGASAIFPGSKKFVRALVERHPEITTVVLNVNNRQTTMVLGNRNITLYGNGWITDRLGKCTFRLSPSSFYQVNPAQTEKLYDTALRFAGLHGAEQMADGGSRSGVAGKKKGKAAADQRPLQIIDAYCGTGTIALYAAAADHRAQITGVELNKSAVEDAKINAKLNKASNVRFVCDDAGRWMTKAAAEGWQPDVLFMDPPRSGSTKEFLDAAVKAGPKRIVYISCGPDTLVRDLEYLTKKGYQVKKIQPVDMFPATQRHVENVVLLSKGK